jgi:hypothetical protein
MDFGDFFRQIPPAILFAPIVFGGLYVGLMAYIIQRARKRRKRARENADGVPAAPEKQKRNTSLNLPISDFLRGELPDRPSKAADWTVPPELRDLPEPDLEMLAAPMLFDDNSSIVPTTEPESVPVVAVDSNAVVSPAAEHDWLSAVTPEIVNQEHTEEIKMVSADKYPQSNDLPSDAVEVMRVYRDLSDGKLIIQMGDQRYRALDDIKNPDLARRFTGLVRELWNMINNGSGRTQYATNEGAVPLPDSSMGGMKSRMGLLTAEQEPPKRDFIQNFARAAMSQSDVKQDNVSGIANAVEEFLQFKLSNTPKFSTRSIHIRPAHDHGVRIEVDGHYFDAIGDVIDPDVRDFLLAMMREWEARH